MYQNSRIYRPQRRRKKFPASLAVFLVTVFLTVVLIVGGGLYYVHHRQHGNSANQTAGSTTTTSHNGQPPAPSFNKKQYSLTDASSLWVIVNKQRSLNPVDYAPASLAVPNIKLTESASAENMHVASVTAAALNKMGQAAAADGVTLTLISGYRSYATQQWVYANEVKDYGQAVADSESARPGHSEHQTGLAADLGTSSGQCNLDQCFGATPAGEWLAANSYKYGFVIRYPKGKQNITGYVYEPWHVRYVGTALATEMHNTGITTLEEFFGLPAAPNY